MGMILGMMAVGIETRLVYRRIIMIPWISKKPESEKYAVGDVIVVDINGRGTRGLIEHTGIGSWPSYAGGNT